jgi:hypothetical protein
MKSYISMFLVAKPHYCVYLLKEIIVIQFKRHRSYKSNSLSKVNAHCFACHSKDTEVIKATAFLK